LQQQGTDAINSATRAGGCWVAGELLGVELFTGLPS
jgi:hypothetical protein